MLRVQLICTGKLKESFYAAACEEYNKRLQRYCSPEIIELPETGDIKRDGAAMLARIGSGAFIVAMCIEGKGCSSEELASLMAQCAVQGKSRVCFLIGGSDGLSDEVKRAADVRLSMSRMTFPHQCLSQCSCCSQDLFQLIQKLRDTYCLCCISSRCSCSSHSANCNPKMIGSIFVTCHLDDAICFIFAIIHLPMYTAIPVSA